jgi:predicted transposase YdaD
MDKQKALELIKQVIDQAVKRGLFENVETTMAVGQAFEIISKQETE